MGRESIADRRRQRVRLFFQIYKVLYYLLMVAMLVFAWCRMQAGYDAFAQTTLMLALIYSLCLLALFRTYGALEVGKKRVMDLMIGQLLSVCVSDGVVFLSASLVLKAMPNILIALIALVSQLALVLLWSLSANTLYSRWVPAQRVAILYIDEHAYASIDEMSLNRKRFDPVQVLNLKDLPEDPAVILPLVAEVEGVFLCGLPANLRNDLMKGLISRDVAVYVRPKISDVLLCTARQQYMFHVPMLACEGLRQPISLRAVKRLTDIVVSVLLLVLSSPVMLAVAIAIKCEDRGPVFYRQERLTRGGRVFRIMKFRSMGVDAESDGVARLASDGDSRITRVGRVIRATRMDELPQLINILRGDMSLVGPRPERPEIAAQYEQQLPEFRLRLRVKAGLTGYAQINGKYNTTPYDKLQMDLIYISTMSIATDLRIILQTIQTLFQKDSTEGIEQGQVTAESMVHQSIV